MRQGLDPGRRFRHSLHLRPNPERLLRLPRPHPLVILSLRLLRAPSTPGLLSGKLDFL
jgi:hypothetical protein